MRKLIWSVLVATVCALALATGAFAQTYPDGTTGSGSATVPARSSISVVSKDRSGNADQLLGWYATFTNSLASDWARSFEWRPSAPATVYLYTNGVIMAADAGFFSVTPITVGQLLGLSTQPTVAVRDMRPIGPGGGNGGWIVGVNVNTTGDITSIGSSTPPVETQGHLVHDLAIGMLQDVAGTGGPQWFREGLADLLANSRVQGMAEVEQRGAAWHQANGSGTLPSVTDITRDWNNLAGAGGTITDASYKVADQAVFFLSQKVIVPELVSVLRRTSAGEDFETVLQSVTGYNLAQLDSAYRVTMPLY